MSGTELRIVMITAPDGAVAEHIAKTVVSAGYAACVNILPGIRSIYRWQGKIEDSTEVLLVAKTTAARYDDLERAVLEIHPYTTPEIVALDAARVLVSYAEWVVSECAATDS